MIRKLIVLLLATALLLSACNMPTVAFQGTSPGAPQAWIDAPLDGMTLPLQPYTLTLHSSDPKGISRMEVSINGDVLATLLNPNPAQLLVYLTQSWQPTAPGRYVISARAQNIAGTWSAEDAVTVEIEGVITPTFTPTFTPTTVITPTYTPTQVITPTYTPTPPLSALSFGSPVLSTTAFQYQYDCVATTPEVILQVPLINPAQGTSVFFFYRLKNLTSNTYTNWNNGLAMTPLRDGSYKITIHWRDIPDSFNLHGDSAEFQYQFVAINSSGTILLKSQVYNNISLSVCK
jgi:hypothetical protein